MSGAGTFDPIVAYTGGDTPYWEFEDGSVESGVSISVLGSSVGLDGTTQTVKLVAADKSAFTLFQAASDDLVGDIDFSVFTGATFNNIALNSNSLENIDFSGISTAACILTFHTQSTLLTVTFGSGQDYRTINGFSCANMTTITNLETLTFSGGNPKIDLRNNTGLTSWTLPSSSTVAHSGLAISNSPYNKALDLSGWTWLTSVLLEIDNCGITSIIKPTSIVGGINTFRAQNNAWTTCDLSGFSFVSGCQVQLYNNASMNSIIQAAGEIGVWWMYNCTSIITVDLSPYTWGNGAFADDFRCDGNSLQTSYTPASSYASAQLLKYQTENSLITDLHFNSLPVGAFDRNNVTINFSNASPGLTAAQVNQALVELDAIMTGSFTGTVTLTGSNAAPDTTSGGYNGTAAKASIIGKGRTVTSN